jgi:hypothetical protein
VARGFTDADLIQFNTGSLPGTTVTATVALPAPTVEGSTVLIHLRNFTASPLQDLWSTAVAENSIPALSVLYRADVAAGEQSWDLILNPSSPPASAGSSFWLFRVEEWANIASLPLVSSSAAADLSPAASTLSTGSTSSFTGEEYVIAFALFSFYKAVADSQVWPTITGLTNGFSVVDTIDFGNGTETTGSGNLGGRLIVTRAYGTQNQDGPVETTATFSGALTNINAQAALAVLRAADVTVMPAPVILVAPGGVGS